MPTMLEPRAAVALASCPPAVRRAVFDWLRAGAGGAIADWADLVAALRELGPQGHTTFPPQREAEALLERGVRAGLATLAWGSPDYPPRLAEIPDPPPLLWLRGVPAPLHGPCVGIVGARAASPHGLEMADRLGADLARAGATVVSGLARGIDSAAHRGALECGTTVAVCGTGADVVYPACQADLARVIRARGALISELPPGAPPRPQHFPRRNRLISGLSLALVVVEASERSGSLITAGFALEQGREVMAVPGHVLAGRNRGAHALLKDGAKLVECAEDVLEELRLPPGPALCRPAPGDPEDPILKALAPGEPGDVDGLVGATGWTPAAILARLLELELGGRVVRTGAGRFLRTSRRW